MGNVEASSPAPQEDIRAEPTDPPKGIDGPHPDGKPISKPVASSEEGDGGEEEERPGLIRDDGTINWDCPCLGGMAHGPCGDEFKAAFSCFHYSTAEQKGSDCLEPFMAMQSCFQKYPEIFGPKEGEEDDLDEKILEAENASKDVEDGKGSQKARLSESEKTSVQIK